jgi:hypothetical protein
MTVIMVRYRVRDESVAEVETGIEKMFAAIEQEQPKGIRFAMGKLSDGVTFVGILELQDGAHNPLHRIPAARSYQEKVRDWVVEKPPAPERLEVVGSYRLFE